MPLSRSFLGALCFGAVTLVLAALAEPSRAQKSRGDKLLQAEALKGPDKAIFDSLRDGRTDYRAEHQAVLDKAARWYVYRLTWPQIQEQSTKGAGGDTISYVVKQCLDLIPDVRRPNPKVERQRQFVKEFGKALVPAVEKVLQNSEPIARINAARILGRLGETGQEEIADPLAKVIDDKDQLDAAKLFALRGMKELFASVEKFKDPEREARAVQAVIAFIQRPPTGSSAEEMTAFHYVRREAVEALAQCRLPVVELNKKVVSQPALELLRIASKNLPKPLPIPILNERVEAAVGACLVQTKRYEKFYNPDYAAQHVGYFITDFVNRYHADRQKQSAITDEPWKIHAAHLRQALQTLGAENKKDPYVAAFVPKAESVLQQVEKSEPVQIQPFRNWLQANPPPSKALFKNDDKAVVKLPTAAEA